MVTAINEANLGITAQVVSLDTSGTNFTIQLTGGTGVEQAFSISESVSELNFSIPSGFSATNASLTVNGIQYSRASNNVDDIIPGVTLSIASSTSGAATVSVTRDTSSTKTSIESFVSTFNDVTKELKRLVSSADSGELRGNSIVRQITRDLQNIVLGVSSTPGTSVTRLSEMGISLTRTGQLEVNDTKLNTALTNNFADVVTLFSADTDNDSEIGVSNRGIAGDLSKLIKDLTSSTGYLTTQADTLAEKSERVPTGFSGSGEKTCEDSGKVYTAVFDYATIHRRNEHH